jgi:Bax protein
MENHKQNNLNTQSVTSYLVAFLVLVLMYWVYTQQRDLSEQIKEQKILLENERIAQKAKELKSEKPKPTLSVSQKKKQFLNMLVPPLQEVYEEEKAFYKQVKQWIENNENQEQIEALKQEYKADDEMALLMALKPHPKSITIAQAAIESAWGQSRFFKEANNIFGVWSYNSSEPRIAASSTRGEKTIWLKKYPTVKEAIKDYYLQLSRSWAFEEFRALNYEKPDQNPYLLVQKLTRYSEKRERYTKILANMIEYNQFTRFDDVVYERPKEEPKIKEKVPEAINESKLNNQKEEEN